MSQERAKCPYCGREVRTDNGAFVVHSITPKKIGDTCPLAEQPVPVTGVTENDHDKRAHLIAKLAWQLRDEDPWRVRCYLTALPAAEVERLLLFALAAIPVDQTVDEMFGWVNELPDAQAGEAVAQ